MRKKIDCKKIFIPALCALFVFVYSAAGIFLLVPKADKYIIYADGSETEFDGGGEALERYFSKKEDGFGIKFSSQKKAFELVEMLSAKMIYSENVAGRNIFYFRSPYVRPGVTVRGEKINIQVSVSDSCAIVGFPLILGGY